MSQTDVGHGSTDSAMADHHRRAVRFFWAVLILASTGSIVGNATHAVLNAPAVPAAVAAAVAIAPPLVLLACTEGVALLLKAKPPTSSTTFWWAALYWAVLLMTVALAVAAFVLSFDALRDLAIRAGVHSDRAWLWPLVVDVSIALSTLCLLALSPVQAGQSAHHRPGDVDEDPTVGDAADAYGAHDGLPVQGRREHARAALAVVRTKRTKQPPEVVEAVLRHYADGAKTGEIADQMNLHHSTVKRIVNNRNADEDQLAVTAAGSVTP